MLSPPQALPFGRTRPDNNESAARGQTSNVKRSTSNAKIGREPARSDGLWPSNTRLAHQPELVYFQPSKQPNMNTLAFDTSSLPVTVAWVVGILLAIYF